MSRLDRFIAAADGSQAYVTIDGDMVDDIAQAFYGTHAGNTERLLSANPGLAARGPTLQAGVIIKIPAAPPQAQPKPFKRLWD